MKSLLQLLITCEAMLRSIGEIFWADKIKAIVQDGDKDLDNNKLEEILSWYGGMGSFNDLIISVHNDHVLNGRNEEKLNDELAELRCDIYREAMHQRNSEGP